MNKNIETSTLSLQHLQRLSGFSHYLLHERLEDFLQKQLIYIYEADIPLLRFFKELSEEERYLLGKKTIVEFLTYLAENKAAEQIDDAMRLWQQNQLPIVDRDSIVAEDITLVNYVRKKSMLDFVGDYTKDVSEAMELVKEIDFFIMQSITIATNLFIDLFKKHLEDHSHLTQKVVETIPGAVYVFDIEKYKGVYSNNKIAEIIGYDHAELNDLGEGAIPSLVHPDDQEILQKQLQAVRLAQDKQTLTAKYRIKTKEGNYRWLANYESVFKRKEDNSVCQTIGITLDINKEQKALEELHKREQQLIEAQNIAQLGDFYWDLENKESTGSPKTLELLEISSSDFENFIKNVHPDDLDKVHAAIKQAKSTGLFNCEYRIHGKNGEKIIWARGIMNYAGDKAIGMAGTVMDITEHNLLLSKLAEADNRHKQAELLTHIGTYSWTIAKDEIE
ncbi:MAG: PAS domain-containing protein, partial [Flavisolibacter sp.]